MSVSDDDNAETAVEVAQFHGLMANPFTAQGVDSAWRTKKKMSRRSWSLLRLALAALLMYVLTQAAFDSNLRALAWALFAIGAAFEIAFWVFLVGRSPSDRR